MVAENAGTLGRSIGAIEARLGMRRGRRSLRDLGTAYKNFFDSVKGKRQGRKAGPPRYKSKKDTRQSIRLNTNAFSLPDDGTVYGAKAGNLKVEWPRRLPAAPTSLTVTKDSGGRYFVSFVVDTEPDTLPRVEAESRPRPRPVRLRRPVRRDEDRQPAPPAPGGEETQAPSAGAVPPGQGIEEPGQGPPQGRTPARQGGRPAPGLPPHGIHTDHSRQPSGVRGRPRGVRPRPHPARQVRTRRGMVHVRRHAGVQGGSARPHLCQGGPGLPVLSGLLGLRIQGRPRAPARPGMDVQRMRHGARPRPQRSTQRPLRRTPNRRRRTGGDAKRLSSAGKTGTRARTARRSRKPPEGSDDPGRKPWTLGQVARQVTTPDAHHRPA